MIKKLQTTTKYYAKTEEEAEGAVIMAESNTKGRIIKKVYPTQDFKRLNLLRGSYH